jgi:hypothetical protein
MYFSMVKAKNIKSFGEINESQQLAWCKLIDAFDGKAKAPRQVALFPCYRQPPERLPETVLLLTSAVTRNPADILTDPNGTCLRAFIVAEGPSLPHLSPWM